jgi:hypothetical protein
MDEALVVVREAVSKGLPVLEDVAPIALKAYYRIT